MKKPTYRTQLSFTKAEFLSLTIGEAGVKLQTPKTDAGMKKMLAQFGLFGTDGNFNTFYPSLNVAEDVMPKPEDYVHVPYRLLSETIVAAGSWRSTSFAKQGVLKSAMDRLKGKPVYTDHNTDSANWVGLVSGVSWSEATVAPDGTKIPAGIDGIISIDAKCNPKVARGAMSGAIGSNSVTVDFEWMPSHSFKDLYEFEDKIGTFASDGRMVCREATNIVDFYETSLLWLGADPFAKKLGPDGNPINIDYSSSVSLSKAEPIVVQEYRENRKLLAKSCLSKQETLYLGSKVVVDETIQQNSKNEDMNKELMLMLATLCGVASAEAITKEHIEALAKSEDILALKAEIETLKASVSQVPNLETSIATLTSEKTALEAEVEKLKPLATATETLLAETRAEAVKFYKLSAKGNENAAIIAQIESANLEAAKGFLTQFGGTVATSFSATCTKCSSTEISFQSSKKGEQAPVEGKYRPSSVTELYDKFTNK